MLCETRAAVFADCVSFWRDLRGRFHVRIGNWMRKTGCHFPQRSLPIRRMSIVTASPEFAWSLQYSALQQDCTTGYLIDTHHRCSPHPTANSLPFILRCDSATCNAPPETTTTPHFYLQRHCIPFCGIFADSENAGV